MKQNIVVLPRGSLWDHPERKQTTLRMPTFRLHPTREVPPTQAQHLTSRISKLEKIFADEIATYTSLTARFQSQYFVLYDKISQLGAGNSDVIIWKIPTVKFVFDSANIARPSTDPLIEPATNISSPIFRTHPHGYIFFVKFYPSGIGPPTGKCA